jgi:hypothetical protein
MSITANVRYFLFTANKSVIDLFTPELNPSAQRCLPRFLLGF